MTGPGAAPHLALERGHRTLTITRKGGKVVTVPLAPRTARAIDLAIGERTEGPVFLAVDGRRCGMTGPMAAWTATRPILLPPTSQVPLDNALVVSGFARRSAAGRTR